MDLESRRAHMLVFVKVKFSFAEWQFFSNLSCLSSIGQQLRDHTEEPAAVNFYMVNFECTSAVHPIQPGLYNRI